MRFLKIGIYESALKSTYYHTNTIIGNSKLPFIHFIDGAYCVPGMLRLLGKISCHFSNSNYPIAVNVHVFLKQLNDFISFPMKSEWLIKVTYQLLQPK